MIRIDSLRIYNEDELTVNQAKSFMMALGDGLYISRDTPSKNVYEAAGLKSYDFALPQDWFDERVKKDGKAPRGVWCYDSKGIFGEFVSLDSCLAKIALRAREGVGK